MVPGIQAWVTPAFDDDSVKKAIVLAWSLRRVFTSKPIVVLTTSNVSKELKEQLEDNFDHVQVIEPWTPNGVDLEEYVKLHVFGLKFFSKCVFLSPESIVLRNCDDIFENYETFAACRDDFGLDSSVFLYSPNLELSRALEKYAMDGELRGNFSNWLGHFLEKNLPITTLDNKYNLKVNLGEQIKKSLNVEASIVTFTGQYPINIEANVLKAILSEAGPLEKHAVNTCLEIHSKVLESKVNRNLPGMCNEPVAIIGLSFRLPGGNNEEEFWNLLENGKEGIKPLPPFRWTKEHSLSKCYDRSIEAGFLDFPVDEFDAKFFGFSPKEAEFLDPQQRLLHEVAWEALEDAMIDPHSLYGTKTGFFVGSWIHDYQDFTRLGPEPNKFRSYMGTSLATEAARLSHFFQTTGPSIGTESGCCSSIVAVHLACKSLQKHETNLAFACGVNLLLHPIDFESMGFVLAKDGRCKTFDSSADGFGRAEACNVLILKRLSDAVKDGDNIWGLIRGSAVTQEGVSKSLGTPTVHCESLAMTLAFKDSGVRPEDVDCIETHGTGTAVGDPLEVAAIAKAYSSPDRSAPVVIGSVKTNVGHTESASGITGIIKVLLSMKNEKIPPHLNLKTLNPAINLEAIPAEIPLELRPWPKRKDGARLAGVSSFGISGTDGHAIIQEPPLVPNQQIYFEMDRSKHILKISAKSPQSMDELLQKYEQNCAEKVSLGLEEDFANLAYSANTGRANFSHRAVIIAYNFAEAAKIFKEKSFEQREIQGKGSKLCFLFTGQGSQHLNMASSLYQTSPIFRNHFDKCDKVLNKYGIYIRDVLWGKDETELCRTLYSQTSIFVVEYCLLKLWESWGVIPDYVMGHSLGEFAAACAAGVLDFEDALKLVAERSRLVDALPRGKMLVIKADKQTVDKYIARFQENNSTFWLDYAALNSPDQTVLAGDSQNVEAFAQYCKDNSIKSVVLAATHAFHSRHMDSMLDEYENVASTVKKPSLDMSRPKFISGVDGKLIPVDTIDAQYWVRHTREKVSFIDACKAAEEEGCTLFLEVGAHPVLSALVMANSEDPVTCLPSLRRGNEDWSVLLESIGKLYLSDWKGEIDWKGFDRYYKRSRAALPFYPFNKKPIWLKTRYCPDVLHPLLGKVLPNASGRTVFEAELTFKTISFVQDHVIGKTIIFPGAAFLEMCLAGGFFTAQNIHEDFYLPRKPIVLSGLQIQSPLALHDHNLCVLQTIVHLEEEEETLGYSVKIYKQDEDTGSGSHWIPHASGIFSPVVPTLSSHIPENIDIPNIFSTWQRSDNREFYKKLPEVGLRFGAQFQSLEMKWSDTRGEAVLMRLKLPKGADNYLIHPVVADAMIQTVMLWSSKGNLRKLHLPVRISEFIWLGQSDSNERFVYCANTASGIGYALLVDSAGLPLAYMQGVEFAETNVKLVESIIQQQQTPMPNLWEEIYKSVPNQNVEDLQLNLTAEEIKETDKLRCNYFWIIFANEMEQLTNDIQNHLESLNRKVNIVPKIDKPFTEEETETLISKAVNAATNDLEGIIYAWSLNPSERDQSLVGLPFFTLCKNIAKLEMKKPPKVIILTQGQLNVEDSDVLNPVPGTVTGIAKTVFNEHAIPIQYFDLCPYQSPTSQINDILANLWIQTYEPVVAFRNGKRFCQKIASCKIKNDPLSIPNGCDRFQLLLPKTKVINDLEFGYLQPYTLAETEVEVKVKATALNFRDVFTVLKPIKDFEDFNAVGLDFAGEVVRLGSKATKWKVGDSVIGMNMNRNLSLPSHIKLEENLLVSLPDQVTFAEGATLPAVFSTVIHCLVDMAKMQKGETLLLHTASGGVRLCAIQLAKHFGVNVIATAGSIRKRNYLRNLGIKHVFNSRTIEFGKQVLEVTNGKGVDIILNSLTGEGFKEASLSALGKNGRFVEISKLNIWTYEEVKLLRPDVFYEVVDLTKLDRCQYEALTASMREYLNAGHVRAIPYETFDALNICQALYYLQKAKHIGKIVCLMPEIKIEDSKFVAQTMLFNSQSTYIVTGGLGGIGLEVAKFMLAKGAKHIALVSRSKPKPDVELIISNWNATGNQVEAFSVDIGDYEKCRAFIGFYLTFPPSTFPSPTFPP